MEYITHKPNEKDGREFITSLSDSGKQFLQTINLGHQQLSQVANRAFIEEEKIQFAQLSNKFSNALKEERTGFHE
ncbi:hypothetical protein [Carnobacterium maltaromaticum]|uniref:hypothetical protein n=1 Tax=Carnobacterium maltaromaticum TaxID=2751 RepID=UPI0039BDE031